MPDTAPNANGKPCKTLETERTVSRDVSAFLLVKDAGRKGRDDERPRLALQARLCIPPAER